MSLTQEDGLLTERNKKEAIMLAAYDQVMQQGVVGFRLLDVADQANCSASLIYRYFGDRDGLIKEVLGRIVEKHIDQWVNLKHEIQMSPNRDVTQILEKVPAPDSEQAKSIRWLRVQALAASTNNPDLYYFLTHQVQRYHDVIKELLIDIRQHLGLTADCDLDALAMLWSTLGLMLTHNDLLIDGKIDDERFRAFLAKILMLN
jgi:AcrR family transcriptional regulator